MPYSFTVKVNKIGAHVCSFIRDHTGADVVIVTAENHEEIAAWLISLMNDAIKEGS